MDFIWIFSGLAFICFLFIIILTGLEYAWLASNQLTIELKKKQSRNSGKMISVGKRLTTVFRPADGTKKGFGEVYSKGGVSAESA